MALLEVCADVTSLLPSAQRQGGGAEHTAGEPAPQKATNPPAIAKYSTSTDQLLEGHPYPQASYHLLTS